MHLVFISSKLPLTKSFICEDGRYSAKPYPHVSRVTSHHEEVTTLKEFAELLTHHANKNRCLFGGELSRPLNVESRAGLTKKTKRQWVVFDFDKVEADNHEQVVREYLPECCQGVDYVAQLSASMFRPDTSMWSGHIFMLLEKPIDERDLRQWFMSLNFSQPKLQASLRLSDSMHALSWPLDPTVAYNSKLIYIAPPTCVGFEPAITQHIELVKKQKRKLTIGEFQQIDSVTIRQKINELRRAIGEPDIDYEVAQYEGHEVLKKCGIADIQGIRNSGDHYIRFNLNGGDSWAYFIDLRAPDLIRNFKSEPFLVTKDAAPDLWKSLSKSAKKAVQKPPLEDGSDVLAFYATNQSSKLKIGVYRGESGEIELNNASMDSAKSWLYEFGMVSKEPFSHKYLVFDPQSNVRYMPNATTINLFAPTTYMMQEKSASSHSTLADLPPVLNTVLRSAMGPCTEKVLWAFVNWLAYIFQFREKTQTAWVINGVPGTGKNTLVKYYLRPLLGNKHVASIQYNALNKEYNGFLETALMVVIEEADINSVDNVHDTMAKLKHWVTDSPLTIRKMNTDHMEMPNYSNFLLFTNEPTPAKIAGNDRRFNFGERQTERWLPTPNEIAVYSSGSELEAFADMLLRWPVDKYAVTQIIDTQARQDAHEATTSINQQIADAILAGDIQFFINRMPTDIEAQMDFENRFNTLPMFKSFLQGYQQAAEAGEACVVTEEQAYVLFRTLIPDTRYLQDSKTWRKRHFKSLGLDFDKQVRIGTKRERGVRTEWQMPATPLPAPKDNVTPIKGRK